MLLNNFIFHKYVNIILFRFSANSANHEAYNKAWVGCYEWKDHDSCQILLNYCSINNYDETNTFCELLFTNITNYNSYSNL